MLPFSRDNAPGGRVWWWVLAVDCVDKIAVDVSRLGVADVKQAVELGLNLPGMAWAWVLV